MWLFQDDKDTKFESNSQRRPSQLVRCFRLFQDDKDTKFESNSQLSRKHYHIRLRCFRTTKIQNLRAIHNGQNAATEQTPVVSGRQRYKIWEQFTTKRDRFEFFTPVVSGRQRYKIWEQFTTGQTLSEHRRRLFQDDKDTKFESNSQRLQ